MSRQDYELGTKIQTTRHSSEAWVTIGRCLREAGIKPGSDEETRLFRWAMNVDPGRPKALYEAILEPLKRSGLYKPLPRYSKVRMVKGVRPMDAEVLRWSGVGEVDGDAVDVDR